MSTYKTKPTIDNKIVTLQFGPNTDGIQCAYVKIEPSDISGLCDLVYERFTPVDTANVKWVPSSKSSGPTAGTMVANKSENFENVEPAKTLMVFYHITSIYSVAIEPATVAGVMAWIEKNRKAIEDAMGLEIDRAKASGDPGEGDGNSTIDDDKNSLDKPEGTGNTGNTGNTKQTGETGPPASNNDSFAPPGSAQPADKSASEQSKDTNELGLPDLSLLSLKTDATDQNGEQA